MSIQPDKIPGQAKIIREIRINPIVPSESVLVATARSMRPEKEETPCLHDSRPYVDTCPFCKGNEAMTPSSISQVPTPDSDWQIRIVENLYPVLGDDREAPDFAFGLQQTIDGYGRHEVVIDHICHGIRIHEMTEEHITLLLLTYQGRMGSCIIQITGSNMCLYLKISEPAAGASIGHTHSQIIAMPVVPDNVQEEVRNSAVFYQTAHRCIFCSLIDEALNFEATIYNRESGAVQRRINVGTVRHRAQQQFYRSKALCQPF